MKGLKTIKEILAGIIIFLIILIILYFVSPILPEKIQDWFIVISFFQG